MASFEEFKQSPLGQRVGAVISNQSNIIRMIALSESSIPAVQAIGKRLRPLMPRDQDLTDVKKFIGRWVREILEPEGWMVVGKGRVAAGNLFSTGAIYGPKQPTTVGKVNDDLTEELEEESDPLTEELEEEIDRWSRRERRRLTAIRNRLFNDPGGGVFRDIPREFVLSIPAKNLWEGIRADAIEYFARNSIRWWEGNGNEPTGHMLSSQVACVNHLYLLRQRPDLAKAVLRAIDPDIVEPEIVDDGYVEFEFIGARQYLAEKAFSRGAHCTSVDAFMIGRTVHGDRRAFLVEWKYVEAYQREDKYIPGRAAVYDDLIAAEGSPFKQIEPRAFYFEPFYQMMRQTLLGWQMT